VKIHFHFCPTPHAGSWYLLSLSLSYFVCSRPLGSLMEKKAQTLSHKSAMGACRRVVVVWEEPEKAGGVAVVLGSAIERLSAAADTGGKFSSAAVKRVVQELSLLASCCLLLAGQESAGEDPREGAIGGCSIGGV